MLSGVEQFIIFGIVPLMVGIFAAPAPSRAVEQQHMPSCEREAPAECTSPTAVKAELQDLRASRDASASTRDENLASKVRVPI